MDIVQGIFRGDRSAVARALSLIENSAQDADKIRNAIQTRTGNAFRIGVTGPPGAGKSTLISELALLLYKQGEKIGIIAIDPTSPFSGGALLGDRIRMSHLCGTSDIFIRSMATRGALGGISKRTFDVADVLDASGKTFIFIETTGAGQTDTEIATGSDLVCLVISPEVGDFVQMMKAGMIEIADIVVINKADRPGADLVEWDVRSIIELSGKKLPIIKTEAVSAKGIDELCSIIQRCLSEMKGSQALITRRKNAIAKRIRMGVEEIFSQNLWNNNAVSSILDTLATDVVEGKIGLTTAIEKIVSMIKTR